MYPSFLSLSLAKIYIFIYSIVEFPNDFKIFILSKINWIKSIFLKNNQNDNQSNGLVEELNVNDQIPDSSPENLSPTSENF